jgi:NAD-dependent SIR2 family protein deacetylase
MGKDLNTRIKTLAAWIHEARHPVFFTGAGISTESGLFDYRGPDGVWTRKEKGLPPRRMEKSWSEIEPNRGHYALVEIQELGRLGFLISQNVDNLHLRSGIRPDRIAELHGNMAKMRCRRCGRAVHKTLNLVQCDCGGRFAESVVHFGQALPEEELRKALEHSVNSDLFVVLGSSLTVTPAADMPYRALQNASTLALINRDATPFDQWAHLRFSEGTGEVLTRAVEYLKGFMGLKS